MSIKHFLSYFLPYGIITLRRRFLSSSEDNVYLGDYSSWQEATTASTGYDADNIIKKVLDSTQKVIDGKAAFERDSVLFDHEEYNFPLLSALQYVASRCNGRLNVLDFGGALGSTFWQNHKFLEQITSSLQWHVVEQPKFIEASRNLRYNAPLSFHSTLNSVPAFNEINVALCSSVFQYLNDWKSIAESFSNIPYILIDRTTEFSQRNLCQIAIQQTPKSIYAASYPLWIFPYRQWQNFYKDRTVILEWVSSVDKSYYIKDKLGQEHLFHSVGCLLEARN